MRTMPSDHEIKLSIIKGLNGKSISVHDFKSLLYKTKLRVAIEFNSQFKPLDGKAVYLYRQRGALGIATHWAYKPVTGCQYEIIGYIPEPSSADTAISEHEFTNWKDMEEIL